MIAWAWHTFLDWHIPVVLGLAPLAALELHHWAERRRRARRRWSDERAALHSLRGMHPGPRSIP